MRVDSLQQQEEVGPMLGIVFTVLQMYSLQYTMCQCIECMVNHCIQHTMYITVLNTHCLQYIVHVEMYLIHNESITRCTTYMYILNA